MASRIDYSQNRQLYVGTTAEMSVPLGAAIIDNQLIIGGSTSSRMLDVARDAIIGSISTASSTINYENKLIVAGKNNYSNGTTWYGGYGQILLSANSNMTGSARQFLITNALDNTKFAIIRSVDASTVPVTDSTASGLNSGTADFVINNAGLIGIGTTSPNTELSVNGAISAITSDYVQGTTGSRLLMHSAGTGDSHSYIQAQNSGGTSSAEDLALQLYGGNVGIATDSPRSQLEVNGQILISNTFPALDFVDTNSFTDVNDRFRVRAGGNQGLMQWYDDSNSSLLTLMTLNPNGDVIVPNGELGVGTSDPNGKLDVTDGNAQMVFDGASSDRPLMYFRHNAVPVDGEEIGLFDFRGYNSASEDTRYVILTAKAEDITDGTEDGSLTFQTMKAGTATQTMTLKSSNVGIGTTDPGSKLEVVGKITIRQSLSNTETNYINTVARGGGSSDADMRLGNSVNGDVLTVHNAGVGIRTVSPAYTLDVAGVTQASGFKSKTGSYHQPNKWQKVLSLPYSSFSYDAFTLEATIGGDTSNFNANAEIYINFKFQNNNGRIYANIVNYGALDILAENFEIYRDGTNGLITIYQKIIRNYSTPAWTLTSSPVTSIPTWYGTVVGTDLSGETNDAWVSKTVLNSMTNKPGNGYIGISQTNPQQQLHVEGAAITVNRADDDSSICFQNTTSSAAWRVGRDYSNSEALTFAYLATDFPSLTGSPVMTLLTGGNLGIGTPSPTTSAKVTLIGNQTFGLPGNGTNNQSRWLSIEGNADGSGEGSGRIFFSEHNSTTAAMDNYGMSIGYRGGSTSVVGASGNTWTGLASIGNGEWGMWGHDNDAVGAMIMSGDRAATYVSFGNNYIKDISNLYVAGNIYHTGDTDNYISFGTDVQSFYTNGSSRIYIRSGGNVGISNTSPDYPLDVSGLTRSSSGFSADGNARIVNWEGSNTAGTAAIKLIATYSNVAQGDRIKIEAVGNISYGAGTDTVVSTIALQMNNNNLLEGSWWQEGGDHSAFTTTGGASVFVKTVATGTYQIFVRAGGYSVFAFTASCNSGTIVPSWTTYTSTITNTNDIDNKWSLNRAIYENSGNVGIGTASPTAILDIKGGTTITSIADFITKSNTVFTLANPATKFGIGYNASDNPILQGFNVNGAKNIGLQVYGGNVGIGTDSPTTNYSKVLQIHASGNGSTLRLTDAVSTTAIGKGFELLQYGVDTYVMNRSAGKMDFYTSGTSRMVILAGGNVGIGTTNPQGKLDVAGSIRLQSANQIYFGGTGSIPYWNVGVENTTNNNFEIAGVSYYSGDRDILLTPVNNGNVGIKNAAPSYALDVTGTIRATGDVIAYSDARVKDNVVTIENALDKVTKLRGVSYTRNDVEDKTTKVGVIAQEVLEVLPEVVQQDDEGKYSVAYGNMVGLLIESIKELKAEVDELKSRL